MNTRSNPFIITLALLLSALNLYAHDPFDGSTRMTVRSDSIEVVVTFGTDAARQILSVAGFSKDEIAELMKPRGPRGHQTLPASVAAQFFAIRSGDKTLEARNATLLYEGMEVIFTLMYPRPLAATLDVCAMYYETISEMRQGSLAVVDENERPLGAALFSRVDTTVQVMLPAKETNSAAATSASMSVVEIPASRSAFKSAGELFEPFSRYRMVAIFACVILVCGCWVLKRRLFSK